MHAVSLLCTLDSQPKVVHIQRVQPSLTCTLYSRGLIEKQGSGSQLRTIKGRTRRRWSDREERKEWRPFKIKQETRQLAQKATFPIKSMKMNPSKNCVIHFNTHWLKAFLCVIMSPIRSCWATGQVKKTPDWLGNIVCFVLWTLSIYNQWNLA